MASQLLAVDILISTRIILAGLLANDSSRLDLRVSCEALSRLLCNWTVLRAWMVIIGSPEKVTSFIVDPVKSKNWVKVRVCSTIDGFAYNTAGATRKIAISILLTYCLFTLAHIM